LQIGGALPRRRYECQAAFSVLEAVVVVSLLAFGVLLVLASYNHSLLRGKAIRVHCASNLRQIGLAFQIWKNDHGGRFPMQVYTNEIGAPSFTNSAAGFLCFQVLSNELANPAALYCPGDSRKTPATNFTTDFSGAHLSYFVCLDADGIRPQQWLAGDDNISNGLKSKDGILTITNNQPIIWTPDRHRGFGNLAFADGSVQALRIAALGRGLALTNHLLLP